ncbi:caspase domain-containing protein [Streptomyces sp. NPDC002120]|uniref:caspase family protein n=1 Tax=Streptomyces sp. NPDC002120 TaxID=3364631 RepID=UPI0036A5AC9C
MADPERHALIVVTSTYKDPGLGALRAPADDGEALGKVLADPKIGGFQVEVLADPDSQQLRVKVDNLFADRSPRDTVLLHFSCHGVKNMAGKLFLATTDTLSSRLASTAIPAEWVSNLMLESRAQRAVVLLDCCYAGAFASGLSMRSGTDAHVEESFQDLDHMGTRRGRAVFTASSSIQIVVEPNGPVPSPEAVRELRPSLFTGALVEGLRTGKADRDGDGKIGMSELAAYVTDQVTDATPHQTPHLWLFGAHGGDMAIAHSGVRPPEQEEGPPVKDVTEARERLNILPFLLAAVLLLGTVFLPLGAYGAYQGAWFHTAVWASLATNAAIPALALLNSPYRRQVPTPARHIAMRSNYPYLCHLPVLAWYTAITPLPFIFLACVGKEASTYGYSISIAGFVTLGLAGQCEIWGTITLWYHKRRVLPRTTTAPATPAGQI